MDEKASKLGNGLSWDIWAVDGNWRTNPPPPPSSTSAPTTDQAHQNMTCLKLGKRQYQEEGRLGVKKDKVLMVGGGFSSSSTLAPVARCQVEGCNVSLKDAKEYYKKHKVCGVHSKSPRVIVLGVEQRFCQQCSRFHAVSEFDETKRSCRRRLAGHNERRKISGEAIMRSRSLDNTTMRSRYCYLPSPSPSLSPTSTSSGHVLSLLSGADFPWVSPVDGSNTSYQSSVALRELIAENRAVHLAQKLYMEEQQSLRSVSTPFIIPNIDNNTHRDWDSSWCNHLCDAAATNPHITLDLMQIACPSFEFLSKKNESGEEPNEDEEEEEDQDQDQCSEIWKSLEEKHLV